MRGRGPLYVLICYMAWGLLPVFWKLLERVDSLYVLSARIVWSMVFTGAILLFRRDRFAGVRAEHHVALIVEAHEPLVE